MDLIERKIENTHSHNPPEKENIYEFSKFFEVYSSFLNKEDILKKIKEKGRVSLTYAGSTDNFKIKIGVEGHPFLIRGYSKSDFDFGGRIEIKKDGSIKSIPVSGSLPNPKKELLPAILGAISNYLADKFGILTYLKSEI